MKRKGFLFVSILFLTATLSCRQSGEAVRVTGTITGADGHPPALAHAHLTKLGGSFVNPSNFNKCPKMGNLSWTYRTPALILSG